MPDRLQVVLIFAIGGSLAIMAILAPFVGHFRTTRPRILVLTGFLLVFLGAVRWTSCQLSWFGALDGLPSSWEWPVGTAKRVITMPDGTHVVAVTSAGRVQIYDPKWKFLRGWAVGAPAGEFKMLPAGPDKFDVMPMRTMRRDTYRLSGDLIARGSRPSGTRYDHLQEAGEPHAVPTAPWIRMILMPLTSWPVSMISLVLLGFLQWREDREKTALQRV